jgi:hypothetical protein
MFWTFIYAIMFVAVFGGVVFTVLSFITGIVNRDRRIISFGLKLLLFTVIAGLVLFQMFLRLIRIFFENL